MRNLGDVGVVSKNSDWEYILTFSILEHKTKSGTKTGGLSIGYYRAFRVPKYQLKLKNLDYYTEYTSVVLPVLSIATIDADNLHQYAIETVSDFDLDYFELLRILSERLKAIEK